MMPCMSNRRHYTQSGREQWLAQFEEYPSTAASFCREHSLCYQTFLRWRREARKDYTADTASFIELELPAPAVNPTRSELVELTFPGGLTLRIQSPVTSQP